MPERFALLNLALRYFYIYDYKSICMVFDVNKYPTDIQIVEKKIELRKTLIYLVIPLGTAVSIQFMVWAVGLIVSI